MTGLHVYCIDVRPPAQGPGLEIILRLVETEGLLVDALLLRYDIALDPFSVCVSPAEEAQILERLATAEAAPDTDTGSYRLCAGAVVVPTFRATVVNAITIPCGVGDPVAASLDVVTVGTIPLRARFLGDAFVTGSEGPRLETALLDQERPLAVPAALWHGARAQTAAEPPSEPPSVIDLVEAPASG